MVSSSDRRFCGEWLRLDASCYVDQIGGFVVSGSDWMLHGK